MAKFGRVGRFTRKEETKGAIKQTLEEHPEGLGVRELIKKSGIKSNETFYKYFHELEETKEVEFREVPVGRGKPKKIYKLSNKGIAHSLEFNIMRHFDKIRESCKNNEQIKIDNFTFSFVVYGIPKKLNKSETKRAKDILKKINSDLIDLDNLREQAINREANKYRNKITKIRAKISQYVTNQNHDKKQIVYDAELQKELESYISPKIREKMKLQRNDNFGLAITLGSSFIDEYSLRPENQLLDLILLSENWDEEELDLVVEQLAKNKYFDQEAIDRIKKWGNPENRLSNFDWQKIKERLDDIPKIRERLLKEREESLKTNTFENSLGITNEDSLLVTKEMLGKEKLEELRKEFFDLDS